MIEKCYVQSTGISLDDRFSLLNENPPPMRRRNYMPKSHSKISRSQQIVLEQIASYLQHRNWRPGQQYSNHQFTNKFGLRRANSTGNLSQGNVKSRLTWNQSNQRFHARNVWQRQGFRRRGGRMRQGQAYLWGRGGRIVSKVQGYRQQHRPQNRQILHTRGNSKGNFNRKTVPTKEELDQELDNYMASAKSVLDKQIDEYMREAMETGE